MEEEETFFKAIKKIKALNRTAYGERSPLWLSVTLLFCANFGVSPLQ